VLEYGCTALALNGKVSQLDRREYVAPAIVDVKEQQRLNEPR
jgi:hypothetical protein